MFRAVALSIVLTLAASPSASLLCGMVRCDETSGVRAVVADECSHDMSGTTASLMGMDSCRNLSRDTAFIREDARLNMFKPSAHSPVSGLDHLAAPATQDPSFPTAPPHWSFDKPPVATALRI